MRSICLLLACAFITQSAIAQNEKNPVFISNPFAKNKWFIQAERNLSYSSYNNYQNDNKVSESKRFSLNAGATYFIADGFGVNLDLSTRFSNTQNGIDTKSRDWMAWAGGTYGRSVSSNFHPYLQANIGYGRGKDVVTNTIGGQNESINKDFGYKAEFGALFGNGPFYVNPFINYRNITTDFDDGEEIRNRLGFGVRLSTSLTCDEYECDSKQGYRQANTRYLRGSQYFDYTTSTMFSTGDNEIRYDAVNNIDETDFTDFKFKGDYAIYVIDYLYAGTEFKLDYGKTEPNFQPGYSLTATEWLWILKAGGNLPVQAPLKNFYGEFGYGFGKDILKSETNGNINESKDNVRYVGVSVGYNWFVGEQVAVVPRVTWSMYRNESTTLATAFEREKKGLNGSIGVRVFLNDLF